MVASAFRCLNRHVDWHRLQFWLAVANLAALRVDLRRFNLFDTAPGSVPHALPAGGDPRCCRTADGSFNDLKAPAMGQAGARFGRNVPIAETWGEAEPALLDPDLRLISRKLLARREFVPASSINLLAAGWVQFMLHDWFDHGPNAPTNPIRIPLTDADDWPDRTMEVPRTGPDPTRGRDEQGRPATFLNTETHWWDASQIYGSSAERQERVRRHPGTGRPLPDGKLHLEAGRLPPDEAGIELAGMNRNWWLGLSVMHTLFAREHNAICDRLKIEYPDQDGEWLFQKARLINAALLAKIHTVEWTPAMLDTPELRFGMRGNWWGALGEDYFLANGRFSDNEIVSGIPGAPAEHHGVPYAITEEFVAVYRMHPLLPDDFDFRALEDGRSLKACGLEEVVGRRVSALYDEVPLVDAIYSLGTSHPGALVLHNYPNALRHLTRQDSGCLGDMAVIDVLRDRERGVPRYCRFRRLLGMRSPGSFDELSDNPVWARELTEVYGDVEKVDLMVGMLAETPPRGFAFSDTAFRVFILMASRRLESDRFFTTDYRPEVYTEAGMDWIDRNGMRSVLLRHFPALAPQLDRIKNAFQPWPGH
jgi:hypothetical protein